MYRCRPEYARTILLGDDFARSSEQDYAEFDRSLCCVASLRVRKMRARHPFRAPLARRDLIIIWWRSIENLRRVAPHYENNHVSDGYSLRRNSRICRDTCRAKRFEPA